MLWFLQRWEYGGTGQVLSSSVEQDLPFLSLGFKCVIEEVVFVERSDLCTAVSEILSCASSFTCFFCEQRLVFFFSRGQPLRALPKFLKI